MLLVLSVLLILISINSVRSFVPGGHTSEISELLFVCVQVRERLYEWLVNDNLKMPSLTPVSMYRGHPSDTYNSSLFTI